jgi:aspartyl-tRNA(Asn)/glutamyl-tRNA(Gln) amidotransferase subunit A
MNAGSAVSMTYPHSSPLTALDAHGLLEGYRRREFSPVEVVDAILARIEEHNPPVNAFVTVADELAREQARAAERAYGEGPSSDTPLLGVPYSVKDTIVTKGVRTTMGSRTLTDWIPTFNAPVVERMRNGGAVLVGKTNTPEFGWKAETSNPLFGTTRNPWDLSRTPGGSSGGAAAAVALGMAPLALGTDAAGSVRIPASFCGVVGYKPSFGRIPMAPAGTLESLGHVGLLARSVRDIQLVLSVTGGADPRDRLSLPGQVPAELGELDASGAPRVAWSTDLGFAEVESVTAAVARQAAAALSTLGWPFVEPSVDLVDPIEIVEVLLATAMAGAVRDNLDAVRALIDPERLAIVERGFALSGADVGAAIGARAAFTDALRRAMEPYDLLATPSVAVPPFTAGDTEPASVNGQPRPWLRWTALSYPFNLSGQPAVSLPCGLDTDGLPVGVQLVGHQHGDVAVLSAAAAVERVLPCMTGGRPLDERATDVI